MKKVVLLILLLILLLISSWFYLEKTYPTTTPLKAGWFYLNHIIYPHAKMEKEVYGFLPYWQIDAIKNLRLEILTEINYFGLVVDESGDFVKIVNNQTDPGFREWENEAIQDLIAKTQISGGKFSLSVAMQKNKTLEKFLDNQNAQSALIANIENEVKSRKLNGVNVDFEYSGEPKDPNIKDKFTNFATKLSFQIRKNFPKTELSIDFYPLSIRKPQMIDVAKLSPLFDKIIVMSYDYYSGGSDTAGPIAPIDGYGQNKYFFDIKTTYVDYLKVVPKEKIVMGIPYYGMDWTVENGRQPLSKTVEADGFPAVLSYGRMRTDPDLKPENCKFDDLAQEKWCFYTDQNNVDHQVWFEDNQSIEAKFNFAKENDFAGISIWSLGYDKDYPDLWNLILSKFTYPKK